MHYRFSRRIGLQLMQCGVFIGHKMWLPFSHSLCRTKNAMTMHSPGMHTSLPSESQSLCLIMGPARVYSRRRPTLYQRPYELRVPTSPYELPAISV